MIENETNLQKSIRELEKRIDTLECDFKILCSFVYNNYEIKVAPKNECVEVKHETSPS